MVELKLVLLGSPTVTVGDQPVVVESRKALAMLFYLALTNQRQGRDWLATLFWPEQDQSRARASLRQAIWLLRNAGLEPWLVVNQDALDLQGEYWCDVDDFQAAIRAGEIDEALTLYRADLLAGFTLRDCPEFDQWHFLQADELRRQLAAALEQWALRCSERGEYEKGLTYARRWLALDPLHEPVHRHLMQLYAYAGQHAAALRQYEECVRLLEDELGVTPEAETVALYQSIKSRQIAPPVEALATSSAVDQIVPITQSAPHPPNHNLPLHITTFVGREAESDKLAKIIADPECRLVSIIGPGGIGKTRLAVQVARRFVDEPASSRSHLFPQGVLFVALNAAESTNDIIAAIAEAADIVFYNNETMRQQLLESLRDRKMLLLLDNFEHLLGSADFVVDLLMRAPNITIIVTSREALNLQGEWLWSLGGLEVPGESVLEGNITGERAAESHAIEARDIEDRLLNYSAVRLFVQSARRVQPQFSLSAEYPHVVQICRLLGGMPLAIELAVAWLGLMPCEQIAREITRNLNFLTTRLRDVPDRHRSIHAVFEYSWRLLSPSEQETFQQLAVFRGGFDYQAAAEVAEASWLDLAALKEKSLLSVNSQGRYSIHELLRQYCAGKLERDPAKKEATLNRFCTYFADFLQQREALLNGLQQIQAAAEVATELDNIRVAWQWALQQRCLDEVSRSVTSLYSFYQSQSRFLEGAEALRAAEVSLQTSKPSRERDLLLARIHSYQGWLYLRLGEFEKAVTVLQRSQALYDQLHEASRHILDSDPMIPLAMVYHVQGRSHRALEVAGEALRLAEADNNQHNLSVAHYVLATSNLALGHFEAARKHADAAAATVRAINNRWFLPYILNESGKVARATGDYAEANSLFQESYAIKREFHDPEGMAVALNHLGGIAYLQAEYEKAQEYYTNALTIYREINDQGGLAASARGLGQVAFAKGDLAAAKGWFEQSLTIAMKIRFWPLIYSLLLDIGHFLMQSNAPALAIDALTLVQEQPGSDYETKEQARQLLHQWQRQSDSTHVASTLQARDEGNAEALLQRILAEISGITTH
jgi:DNA-binding SARP family transcriptional activator/predicted ATPase